MTFRLYMDEHVPAVITEGLRGRGHDVLTVQDDGRTGADDSDLLDRATRLGRVMFTRDTDFLKLAARRQGDGIEFLGVIYAHPLRVSVGRCVRELELMAASFEREEMMNRVEYLPLQ